MHTHMLRFFMMTESVCSYSYFDTEGDLINGNPTQPNRPNVHCRTHTNTIFLHTLLCRIYYKDVCSYQNGIVS